MEGLEFLTVDDDRAKREGDKVVKYLGFRDDLDIWRRSKS